MPLNTRDILSVAALTGLCASVTLAQAPAPAATPPAAAAKPAAAKPVTGKPGAAAAATAGMTITATSANVTGAGEKVEFYINHWSTDADRDKIAAAWNTKPAAPAARAGAEGAAGRNGGAAGAAAGGRAGRGGADAPAAPRTPEGALAAVLKDMTPAGYFWTSEVGGYVVRYAVKLPGATPADSRIVLLTDKRLGAAKNTWQPVPGGGTANTYEFSLIELRIPAKGEGEGKASVVGTVTLDPSTRTMTLENYDGQPVTLRGVTMRVDS